MWRLSLLLKIFFSFFFIRFTLFIIWLRRKKKKLCVYRLFRVRSRSAFAVFTCFAFLFILCVRTKRFSYDIYSFQYWNELCRRMICIRFGMATGRAQWNHCKISYIFGTKPSGRSSFGYAICIENMVTHNWLARSQWMRAVLFIYIFCTEKWVCVRGFGHRVDFEREKFYSAGIF